MEVLAETGNHHLRLVNLSHCTNGAVDVLRETNETDWAPVKGREYDNSHGPPENWGDKIKQPPTSEQLTSKR